MLLYQTIEQVLKLFLPLIRATEKEALQLREFDWRELLDSKKTLGQLAGVLMERTSGSNGEGLASWLQTVVAHRNEVVHHFYEQEFASLRTEKHIDDALEYLQVRHDAASQLLGVLQAFAMCALDEDAA